jgi:hypothetical protein
MTRDATFEEGSEQPLRLMAVDRDDLSVVSALVQDAILPSSEMAWRPSERRFAMLINRFRWEDRDNAAHQHRGFERVQSVLVFDTVTKVAYSGIDPGDKDQILSILSLDFEESDAPSGVVTVNLAGDGALALNVECLDVLVKDVTRPYLAPSGSEPRHSLDEE